MVDNDLSGRYLQLPAATKILHISKSVYWVASYLQLPPATKFQYFVKKVN